MSVEYCQDCERIVEDNTTSSPLTPDLNAYDDGEYIVTCDFCGGDAVINLPEDDPNEIR